MAIPRTAYICAALVIGAFLIFTIPHTRLKQATPEISTKESIDSISKGYDESKLQDLGASLVLSALSKLGKKLQGKKASISEESNIEVNSGDVTQYQSKFQDLVASPVFSALSKLDKKLQGKTGLPDIIELDYQHVVLTKDMNPIQHQDAIITLSLQREVVCLDWEMYGLKTDGGWPVCKAKALIPTQPCLVYSFGIRNDWSFDDAYRKAHGCIIRTFDPSMGRVKEHEHSPGVFFYPIGLSNKKGKEANKGWNMDTYKGLLTRFKEENKTISYLKFDIETMEWIVLDNMLADGLLSNVMQLSFEIHVDKLEKVPKYFKLIKRLHYIGFRRWFYHHRLNGNPFQVDQSYINMKYVKQSLLMV